MAAIRLARVGDARARPLLEAALHHPDPFYRANAVRWLRNAAAGVVDPVPEVRRAALEAAPRTPEGRAILLRLLEDVEPVLRARAAVEIFNRGGGHDLRRLPDLEIAVRFQRGWVEGSLVLGGLRLTAGDAEGAADAFLAAVTQAPSLDFGWRGLAAALTRAGRTAEAAGIRQTRAHALADRVVESPGDADLAVSAADAYLLAGQPLEARRVLEHALRSAKGAVRERLAQKLRSVEEAAAAPAGGPHR